MRRVTGSVSTLVEKGKFPVGKNIKSWGIIAVIIILFAILIYLILTIYPDIFPGVPKEITTLLTTAIVGLIVLLVQQSIKLSIDTSLENHKKELQKELVEHQTRFTRLHQDRAEVTGKLYGMLTRMERSLTTTQNIITQQLEPGSRIPNEVRVKNIEQTMKDYSTLQNYFYERNIYLPEEICEKIQTFLQKCDQTIIDQTLAPPSYDEENKSDVQHRSLQGLNRAFDTVHKQMPDLRDEIKKEFQKLLGA